MFKYLNKGMSTPIAIAVILLLAVSVGGFTLWQDSEMQKEKTKLPEIKIVNEIEEEVEPPIVEPPEEEEPISESGGLFPELTFPNGGEIIEGADYCDIKWNYGDSLERIGISLLVYDENKNRLSCYPGAYREVSIVGCLGLDSGFGAAKAGHLLVSFDELLKDYSFTKMPAYYKIKLTSSGLWEGPEDLSDDYFNILLNNDIKIISVGDEIGLWYVDLLNFEERTFYSRSSIILTDNSTEFSWSSYENHYNSNKITFEELPSHLKEPIPITDYTEYFSIPHAYDCRPGPPTSDLIGIVQEISPQGQITVLAKQISFNQGH